MATVKSGYVMNAGNPLNYLEWGRPDAPTVVLIAPIRHPAYVWRDVAERLSDRFRLIALNLRGHGDSGPFPVREYNPDFYVDDIHAFVTHLGLVRPVLLGFSVVMSGAVVAFAAKYPELARALVLLDGGIGYPKENVDNARARMNATPVDFPNWEEAKTYYAGMLDQSFTPKERIDDRAPYVFRQLPDGKVTWKYDPLLRELWPGEDWRRNTGFHPPEVWRRVGCPLFVIKGGGKMHLAAKECAEVASYVQDGSWALVPDVTSHFVHDENPKAFVSVLTPFLEKVCRA